MFYVLMSLLSVCSGVTYNERTQQYVNLVSLYSVDNVSTVDVIPILNVSSSMNVTVDMILYAINDFDEVAGNIELVGALNMSWQDDLAVINAFLFNNVEVKTSFLVPYNKIWTPKLVLSNAVDDVSAVGDLSYMCRFHMDTYRVQWMPRVLIKGACSPDVTYYPFDRQSCVFTYIPWGYYSDEVLLLHREGDWDLSSYEENGEWTLIETKTETFISSSTSKLKLSLTIERKPLYFAFNIILPVLVLCCLNSMVFWLPAASGERVGFSVTCFLSFVVLLNLVFDILPRSSSPISYLCYYLVVMMVFSGMMTGFVIVEMNAFHKDEQDKVPTWLQAVVKFITFRWCCRCRHNEVSDTESQTSNAGLKKDSSTFLDDTEHDKHTKQDLLKRIHSKMKILNAINGISNQEEGGIRSDRFETSVTNTANSVNEVTWVMVGNLLDKLFFAAFLGGQIFFSVTFLLPLGFRAMGP